MVVVALLSVDLVESVDLVSVELVVNCTIKQINIELRPSLSGGACGIARDSDINFKHPMLII